MTTPLRLVVTWKFDGLLKAENLVKKIGPPKWPWAIDRKKVARGRVIYAVSCGEGCHEIKKGEARAPVTATWRTPVINVGTDTKYYDVLSQKTVSSGILSGFSDPVDSSAPLIPDLIKGFNLSLTLVALLPFAFFIAYGVMSIPSGMMIEKYKEKKVMIIAFVVAFVGSLILALFPNYLSAVGSLFLIGC